LLLIMIKVKRTEILNHIQSEQKIERMAYEILEKHAEEKKIILAGIANRGFKLASILEKKLKSISKKKVLLVEVGVDKRNPFMKNPSIDCSVDEIKNFSVVVVDDVLNSGRTMLFAMNPFLNIPIHSLSVAVLCNRSYRDFPVEANFVGLSLSTTLQERIEVEISDSGKINAYLV